MYCASYVRCVTRSASRWTPMNNSVPVVHGIYFPEKNSHVSPYTCLWQMDFGISGKYPKFEEMNNFWNGECRMRLQLRLGWHDIVTLRCQWRIRIDHSSRLALQLKRADQIRFDLLNYEIKTLEMTGNRSDFLIFQTGQWYMVRNNDIYRHHIDC